MKLNMGLLDRTLRLILAGIFAYLFFSGQIPGMTGTILLIVAIVFAATSAVGVCPLYLPFGISTRKQKSTHG